jgi:hypothetical protein
MEGREVLLRRGAAAVAALALVAPGCGGDDAATSCPELADEVIAAVQQMVDQATEEQPDADFDGLEGRMAEFEEQADELGCSDDEMERLVLERVDDIEVEGPLAPVLPELLRDIIDGTTG